MMNNEEQNGGHLLSGQEPHQKEEMEQAEAASRGSFTLEPEKGLTAEPEEYNQGDVQGNIKQAKGETAGGATEFDDVSNVELDAGQSDVTADDLQALDGQDQDEDSTM